MFFSFVFQVFMNESQGDSFRVNRVCRVAFGYVTISQIKVAKSCQNTRQYTMKLCEKHFLGIMTQIANEL